MMQQNTSPQINKFRLYIGSTLVIVIVVLSCIVTAPILFLCWPLPFSIRNAIAVFWAKFVLLAVRVFCGISHEVEGLEHIKDIKSAVVLSKHQSAWETIAYKTFLPAQTSLLKRSLLWFPIWGWGLATLRPIAIERKNQREALRILVEKGKKCLDEGIWVITYPEGTRTTPGTQKPFSAGGAMLAQKAGYPVIPIAHNAGTLWPRYSFFKYPGTIKVKIGPIIETTGKKAKEINAEAEAWINKTMRDLE